MELTSALPPAQSGLSQSASATNTGVTDGAHTDTRQVTRVNGAGQGAAGNPPGFEAERRAIKRADTVTHHARFTEPVEPFVGLVDIPRLTLPDPEVTLADDGIGPDPAEPVRAREGTADEAAIPGRVDGAGTAAETQLTPESDSDRGAQPETPEEGFALAQRLGAAPREAALDVVS